jgi:hypothetical protein
VYARRYDDPSAITLARLASRLVDAPKQGLRLRRDKWTDILRGLKVSVPNYIEPKGVRTPRNTSHIMDILVLEIIPEYQSRVLKSFNDNAGSEDLPIDSDIRGFYEKVKEKYPALVETLRNSLANLEKEWISFITKSKATQDKNREFMTCSPTKKGQKKSSSRISQSELVTPSCAMLICRRNFMRSTLQSPLTDCYHPLSMILVISAPKQSVLSTKSKPLQHIVSSLRRIIVGCLMNRAILYGHVEAFVHSAKSRQMQ